jgi:hypothetical protein
MLRRSFFVRYRTIKSDSPGKRRPPESGLSLGRKRPTRAHGDSSPRTKPMLRRTRCNGQKLKATSKAALRTEHLRLRSFTDPPNPRSRRPSLTYQHPANPMGGLDCFRSLRRRPNRRSAGEEEALPIFRLLAGGFRGIKGIVPDTFEDQRHARSLGNESFDMAIISHSRGNAGPEAEGYGSQGKMAEVSDV